MPHIYSEVYADTGEKMRFLISDCMNRLEIKRKADQPFL